MIPGSSPGGEAIKQFLHTLQLSTNPVIKIIYCLRKRHDVEIDRFYRYWLEEPGPLVKSVAGTIGASRYAQSLTMLLELDALMIESRGLQAPQDGVTRL